MSRVMTVSKARSIHGLTLSVSVVSWTLLFVLLLSSSFSHIHRSGKRDLEDSTTGRNEFGRNTGDAGARSCSLGFHPSILDEGQGYSGDYRSSLQVAEAAGQNWLTTNAENDLSDARDLLADQSVLSKLVSPTSGVSTLDALQYAEYGAGLLQNPGAAEENSKGILLSYLGGGHNPTATDHRRFTGQDYASPRPDGDCLCSDEFSAQELCQSVDVVREHEPDESHLVCKRETVSGTISCYLGCSYMTQCFKLGMDSRICHYDGSLLNLLPRRHEIRQNSAQYWLACSESVTTRMTNDHDDFPSWDSELGQIEILEAGDILRTPAVDRSVDKAISFYREEDTLSSGNIETDVLDQVSDTNLLVTNDFRDFRDDDRPSREVNVKVDTGTQRLEENILLSTKVYSDRLIKDSSSDEDSGLSAPSHVIVGIENVNEGLAEELGNHLHTTRDAKPITSGGLDNGFQPNHVTPKRVGSVMSLDEYKRSISEKQQKLGHDVNLSIVQSPKLRHIDESYNYADSSHGAKVLSSNKEAKGPNHIISSDKDKYLRNPCSAEDKYVVLELSEETFVDTVVIANFEFHSANLKDFEVSGSPVYPAKEWILLGRFRAENVRHRQKFTIEDPKLVRYLKLKMLTHWGSEFFCTLSAVQVYGVDVIKNLLDDWIVHEDGENAPRTQMGGLVNHDEENAAESLQASARTSDAPSNLPPSGQFSPEVATPLDPGSPEVTEKKTEGSSRVAEPKAGDTGSEVHYNVGGKTPGDSVLKILMQKVKALESSQSLFYNYLEDMNLKYKAMLSELDKDLVLMTERLRNEASVAASLAMRLAELEVKRREERAYMGHKFALIAANFTENIEFMRWQIHSMERREITAIILAMLSLILSGLLHLLASCLSRNVSSKTCRLQTVGGDSDEAVNASNVSLVCSRSSSVVLYLASGLAVLVLTV